MNNVVFSGEGPVMKGWWSNPLTGDSFEVRDTYFQDNLLIVQTTDGRMLNYEMIQNYVQVKDKPNNKPMISKPKLVEEELPPEVANLLSTEANDQILEEDKLLLGNLTNVGTTRAQPRPEFKPNMGNFNKPSETDINSMVIAKALKEKTHPTLNIDVQWNDTPVEEMKLLINILKVKPEEIINWYLNSININDLLAEAKVKMAAKLNNVLNGKEESTIILERTPDPENNAVKYLKYPITDPTPDWNTATKPSDVVSLAEGKYSLTELEAKQYSKEHNIDMTPTLEEKDTMFQKPKKTTKRKTTKKTK